MKKDNPIQAILFDLDGTLVDTAKDFVYIIQQIAEENQLIAPSEQTIVEQVSAGVLAMVSLFQASSGNHLSNEQILTYQQQFLDNYEENICIKSEIYQGLNEFLTDLEKQNIAWGVVTNKPRYLSEQLLQALDLDKRCSVLVCPDDVTHSKPSPEPLFLALNTLNINRNQADRVIYVGDHIRDIEAGQRAGMKTVVANYGYISTEEQAKVSNWGADKIANTSQQLVEILTDYIKAPSHSLLAGGEN